MQVFLRLALWRKPCTVWEVKHARCVRKVVGYWAHRADYATPRLNVAGGCVRVSSDFWRQRSRDLSSPHSWGRSRPSIPTPQSGAWPPKWPTFLMCLGKRSGGIWYNAPLSSRMRAMKTGQKGPLRIGPRSLPKPAKLQQQEGGKSCSIRAHLSLLPPESWACCALNLPFLLSQWKTL